ncbi:MAG: hypothetical protein Q8941_05565 [Bacteroidota bacterium]|nr:hypothetical protein [Bacteroidota bacterium]
MRHSKYLLFISLTAIGCKPVAYFNTPNDVFKKEAVVHLLNGTVKKGEISIQFETGYGTSNFISLKNGAAEEKIAIDSVISYSVGDEHYYLKKVDIDLNGSEKLLFVKMLTKENSRIKLYELFEQKKQSTDGQDHFSYFISLPTHDRLQTWNTGSRNLVPNFDEKMSKIVEDCPALANKIRQNSKGYFITGLMLSNQKKVEVLLRIINEYDDCH